MHLDTDESIGAAFGCDEEMRKAMATIAAHTQSRGEQQHWAEHLRFLAPGRPSKEAERRLRDLKAHQTENPTSGDGSTEEASEEEDEEHDFCSCTDHETEYLRYVRDEIGLEVDLDSHVFRQPWRGRQLTLTSPNDTPDCVHYVAVSYCWSSTARSDYPTGRLTILDADGHEREPACPHSLLERVIRFAQWKQTEFIWIDQECIDQSNPVDQSVGIQAMDLVYQRAAYSLAVLEAVVREQRHLDALQQLYENMVDINDEDFARDVVNAIKIITADPWFERAWCLQESTSGNRNMTLLIRCSEDLEVPSYLASEVRGCFELDLPWLHTMISSLGGPLDDQQHIWPRSLQRDVRDVMEAWYANMPPDASTEYDVESKTTCNAAQALVHLERRQNTVVADRLAIMANLCGYDVRLDANALDRLGYGFSICALTLAVLNGDFSIQVSCEGFLRTVGRGQRSGLYSSTAERDDATRPFSWSLPMSASLERLTYYDYAASPLRMTVSNTSLEQGLRIKGVLFIADRVIDLRSLATSFNDGTYTKSPSVIDTDVHINVPGSPAKGYRTETNPGIEDVFFLLALLCTLYNKGYPGLVQLLWDQYRLRGTKPQREGVQPIIDYLHAPFEEIVEVDTGGIKWPNPIPKFSPSEKYEATRTHPFSGLDGPSLEYIKRTVLDTGRLVVSRAITAQSYTAIFEDAEVGSVTLAPRSNGQLHTPWEYSWYPSNWVVSGGNDCSSLSDQPSSWTCGRALCGLWQGEEELEESVTLW